MSRRTEARKSAASIGSRLLFGAIGGFVGATAGWICIGLLTPGDFFGAGSLPMLGLVRVVVRFGDRGLRQTIASCDEVTRGNALGDVGGAIIDIGGCDQRILRRANTSRSVSRLRESVANSSGWRKQL